ncbi:MAG: histidinol dehydrogenase, partial [Rhodospirillaceae bacterium]|nr:histidinol dehydrogenase [Rhodospirillaceae bacterium]
MARFLKQGQGTRPTDEAERQVRQIVEGIIDDVKARGDDAIREMSEKFDKWSPESFKMSAEEIDRAIAELPSQTIDDIK